MQFTNIYDPNKQALVMWPKPTLRGRAIINKPSI